MRTTAKAKLRKRLEHDPAHDEPMLETRPAKTRIASLDAPFACCFRATPSGEIEAAHRDPRTGCGQDGHEEDALQEEVRGAASRDPHREPWKCKKLPGGQGQQVDEGADEGPDEGVDEGVDDDAWRRAALGLRPMSRRIARFSARRVGLRRAGRSAHRENRDDEEDRGEAREDDVQLRKIGVRAPTSVAARSRNAMTPPATARSIAWGSAKDRIVRIEVEASLERSSAPAATRHGLIGRPPPAAGRPRRAHPNRSR